jgi:hypothetical protein
MLLVLTMIIDPAAGWGRVVAAARSAARLFFLHLLPMIFLACLAEGFGMARWGKRLGELDGLKTYPLQEVIAYQVCQLVLALLMVFICAWAIKSLGSTFHMRQRFTQSLAVSIFGLGPVFLMRCFDAFPAVNPWVTWSIGAVLAAVILYQGAPRLLNPDPAHAYGLYLSCVVLLVAASGIVRFLTASLLQASFPFSEILPWVINKFTGAP